MGKEKKMGETVIEKIIRNNVGKTVKPGVPFPAIPCS